MPDDIAILKGKDIRKTIHEDKWWFVVKDIVEALVDSVNDFNLKYFLSFTTVRAQNFVPLQYQ